VEEFLRPFLQSGKTVIPTDSGRSALVLALRVLSSLGFSGTAWLPAYCCPSLPRVFRNEGMTIRRYGVAPGFRPVFPSPGPKPRDAVLVIHYFGFPNDKAQDWVKSITTANRPYIIEDCAGSSLTAGLGFEGDFALFSFRKFFDIADGGALVSRFPVETRLNPPDPSLASEREEAFRAIRGGMPLLGRELLEKAEERLDSGLPDFPRNPAPSAWRALIGKDFPEEARLRREFARKLLECIVDEPRLAVLLKPVFPNIPEDSGPLVLPVEVSGDSGLLSAIMRERGMECPVLWNLNPSLRHSFPFEYRLGRRTVGLPASSLQGGSEICRLLEILETFATFA